MSDVLVRDVPEEDLEPIRAAAAVRGVSLQSYLLDTLRAQATYLRRQDALQLASDRLDGGVEVPEEERAAVLDAVAIAHAERADTLGGRAEG